MYEPGPFNGESLQDYMFYIQSELQQIAAVLSELEVDSIRFNIHHSEPDKPAAGQVYYADGSDWNPGYGKGLYEYSGDEWLPLTNTIAAGRPPSRILRLRGFAPKFTNTTQRFSPSSGSLTIRGY